MKKLRWYDYITINLFWLGLNIRNTSVGSVFTPYLIALFVPAGKQNSTLGFISTAGLVIAMLVQPAAGLLSDRSTSRFGRRRPFIVVGSLFDIVFLAMIALSGNVTMLLVATLLIQFSANTSHGPLQGLIPDLVPEEERGRASAVKAVMELIPIVLVGFTIAQLVGKGQLGWAVFVAGAAILVTLIITVIFVKEEPLKEKPTTSFKIPMLRVLGMLAGIALGAIAGLIGGGVVGGLIGLAAWPFVGKATALAIMVGLGGVVAMVVAIVAGVWSGTYATLGQDALRNSSFTWWIVNRLLFLAAATSFQGFLPFFLMYAFGMTAEQAASANGTLMTIIGLFIIASALGGGWVADRFGKRRTSVWSGWIAALGACLVLSTIWLPQMFMIYIAGIFIGLGTGFFMTSNWALGTDLVPAEEAGRYLGISNLAGAGAGMIGKGIGGPIADYLNTYLPGLGYFAIFASYAVLFALSAVSMKWVKHTDK
jgi:MFS family permease